MMSLKIELKNFEINLMLEFFYVFKVGIARMNFLKLKLGVTFLFFKFPIPIFWIFLLFTFFFEFALFSPIFFPTRIAKLKKFKTEKHVGWGEGCYSNYLNPKFHKIKLCSFYKRNKCKIYYYIIKKNVVISFQICVVNHCY